MYSYEDRIRAVELDIKLGKRVRPTIRQLGYPTKNALKSWHREYGKLLDMPLRHACREPKYLQAQKAAAVEHYLSHDRCIATTIRALGCPCRGTLTDWVREAFPDSRKAMVGSVGRPNYSESMKQIGVIELCSRPGSAQAVNRDFQAAAPNEKWPTDITEFQIPAGKVYLSPIIDYFDGMVVSWTIATSPDAELVNTMLDASIQTVAETTDRPVVHSDRSGHYRWPGWLSRKNDANLTRSMFRKACSPDNAACEGFFGRLKYELFYPRDWKSTTIEQFIEVVDICIRWYNEKQIKISLGSFSPIEYRERLGLTA